MIAAIRGLLASRKFVLLLVGTVVAIGGHLGLKLDPEIIGMVLGLIAVGVGSIAYEDGQAKRATVIDGGALDGPMSGEIVLTKESAAKVDDMIENPPPPTQKLIDLMKASRDAPSIGRDVTVAYPTKADVVGEMVRVDEAVL